MAVTERKMSMMLYGNPKWGRSSYQPETGRSEWEKYVDRQLGGKSAKELREFQAKLYVGGRLLSLPPRRNRSLMEELLWDDKVRKRHSARVRQSLRATSPAATAEQMWAGYSLKVRELTKQERAHRRELRWMLGYWGADAYNLPNYDKVWGNWMQVHTQPLHARKKLYRDITGKTFYGAAIPVRGQR